MATPYISIIESQRQFDLNAPLSDDELKLFGMLTTLPASRASSVEAPVLQDINEVGDETSVDALEAFINGDDYNAQYAHYLRCQALASLVAFDEGWQSLEELVLNPYVRERRREDAEYRGDDPNKAFSLRVRKQVAEDFVKFIRAMIVEAVNTPKPSLAVKK